MQITYIPDSCVAVVGGVACRYADGPKARLVAAVVSVVVVQFSAPNSPTKWICFGVCCGFDPNLPANRPIAGVAGIPPTRPTINDRTGRSGVRTPML